MLFTSMGNIQNYVKTLEMEQKWREKKANPAPQSSTQVQLLEEMRQRQESYTRLSLDQKISSGRKLSQDEMEYLRKNHPELYDKANQVNRQREEYNRALQRCRTKEEVRMLNMGSALSAAGAVKDAARRGDLEACLDIHAKCFAQRGEHIKFQKTVQYSRLPKDHRELSERRRRRQRLRPPFTSELIIYGRPVDVQRVKVDKTLKVRANTDPVAAAKAAAEYQKNADQAAQREREERENSPVRRRAEIRRKR